MNLVLEKVIGPVMIFAAGATAALVAIRRGPAPPIVLVPMVYVVVAIAASFVIRLKEPAIRRRDRADDRACRSLSSSIGTRSGA